MRSFKKYNTKKLGAVLIFISILLTPIVSVIAYSGSFDSFIGGSHGNCHGNTDPESPTGYVSITSSAGFVVEPGETFTLSIQALDFSEAIGQTATMGFSSARDVGDNNIFTFDLTYYTSVGVDSSGNTEFFDFVVTAPTIEGSYTLVADILDDPEGGGAETLQWASGSINIDVQIPIPSPPTFSNLLESSDPIELGEQVIIYVDITDPDGLQPVYIEISGSKYEMRELSGDTYEHNWTPSTIGILNYVIHANDTTGDSSSMNENITVLESKSPTFDSLLKSADPLKLGQNETIFINAYDSPGSGVKQVILEYGNANHSMENYFGNIWRWSKWKPSTEGEHEYSIFIEDNVNNWNSTTGSITVVDSEGPILDNVTKIPDPLEFGNEVTFQVDAQDIDGISSVIIELENSNYTMSLLSGNTFQYNWTPSTCGVKYYKIYSNDSNSNWNQIQDILLVQDTTPPAISNFQDNPYQTELNQKVMFQVDVEDFSNITQVLLEIDGEVHQMINISANTYEVNWTPSTIGEKNYIIRAIDAEGNINTTSGSIIVYEYLETQIIIDDSDPNYDWNKTASENRWCNGKGTWSDPYIIENVTVNAQSIANGILIKNSDVNFIIRNNVIFNSNDSQAYKFYYGGIKLIGVKHGKIINNELFENDVGISLNERNSNKLISNITVLDNIIYNNRNCGIILHGEDGAKVYNNTISGNTIFGDPEAIVDGIKLVGEDGACENNVIINNVIFKNRNHGIITVRANNNFIFNNEITGNGIGIYFWAEDFNNTISENIIRENEGYGIHIRGAPLSAGNNITNNEISENEGHGIYIQNGNLNTISDNEISENEGHGIYIQNCNLTTISNNSINNNDNGLNLYGSNYNSIFQNNITLNRNNGMRIKDFKFSNITENHIYDNGAQGVLIDGGSWNYGNIYVKNTIHDNSGYGIWQVFGSDINHCQFIENEIYSHSAAGFFLNKVSNSTFERNIIYDHGNGIQVIGDGFYNNTIYKNTFFNNLGHGLFFIVPTEKNIIFFNAFFDNGINAEDLGSNNSWDDGEIGNYWDDYSGLDTDGDGIGETPYNITPSENNNSDRYPLSENPVHLGEKIHVDDSGISAYNWSRTAFLKFWCDGSGTEMDPYTIQNLNINGENDGSCILIGNSTAYFIIKNNVISNSGGSSNAGVKLENVNNGMIINNYFVGNVLHAVDNDVNNSWDDGEIGNYWDDYDGYDTNGDGIGETPYNVQGLAGSIDNFPIWDVMDDIEPIITVYSPKEDDIFGYDTPFFNISIAEYKMGVMWYQVEDGTLVYITETNGSIDLETWSNIPEGPVIITFFASDDAGNVGSIEITIKKEFPPPPDYTEIILTSVGASFLIVFLTLSTTMVVHNEKRQKELVKQQMNRKKIIAGKKSHTSSFHM